LLASRGVKLDIIVDEGPGINVDGYPPYTDYPLALVGTAEKGYASIEVSYAESWLELWVMLSPGWSCGITSWES
jgi:hypothetical protein